MSHNITIMEPSGIIQIVYEGEVTLEERINLISELSLEYIDNIRPKILIDARALTSSMSATEQQIWGQFVASKQELQTAFVALVYDSDIGINKAAIEQAQKLGHKVEIFYDESLALKWLNGPCN